MSTTKRRIGWAVAGILLALLLVAGATLFSVPLATERRHLPAEG